MMIRLLLAICTALPLVACNATQSGGTSGAGAARSSAGSSSIPRGRTTITGNVERVWEDGFRLNTGGRSVNVDTWDVFGDGTRGRVSPGQRAIQPTQHVVRNGPARRSGRIDLAEHPIAIQASTIPALRAASSQASKKANSC
jgi:hypothetical protein